MITIAITGHHPDAFLVSHYSQDEIKRIVNDIAYVFKREHGDDLCFNLGGTIGVDLWMGQACIEHGIKYHMYLPSLPEIQSKFWEEEFKTMFDEQLKHAVGIDIINPSNYDKKDCQVRNIKMINDSNFVVAFWVGKRRGETYNCIKYALEQSKFVFNALDHLKPIFKDNLKKGWTPPSMRRIQ